MQIKRVNKAKLVFWSIFSFKNLEEDHQIPKIPESLENVLGIGAHLNAFFGIIMKNSVSFTDFLFK